MTGIPFVKFPSIEQFRSVVADVKHYEEDGVTITFTGTTKIHGTNAGVGWDFHDKHLSCQSRKRTISIDDDNAGFAKFVNLTESETELKRLMLQLQKACPKAVNIILYGEWCGKGIQRGVAVNKLPQMFVIFNGIYHTADDSDKHWFTAENIKSLQPSADAHIFQIFQFGSWVRNITFKQPELSLMQNELVDLTTHVEAECPVGKYFGVSGTGEGIVWASEFNDRHYRFKVKGDKHSVTKVKKLASVDIEKLTNITEFIDYAVTDNRMEQGYNELFTDDMPSEKDVGRFIKWVRDDVIKEEQDTMKSNGITAKDIGKQLALRVKLWFNSKNDRGVLV